LLLLYICQNSLIFRTKPQHYESTPISIPMEIPFTQKKLIGFQND
jgi:hypothetical protein